MSGLQVLSLIYWLGWTAWGKISCEGAERRGILLDAHPYLDMIHCFQHLSEHTDFNRNPKYKTHRPWWVCIALNHCSAFFLLTPSLGSPQKLTGVDMWVYTCHKGSDSSLRTLDATLTSISKSNTLQSLCLQNYLHFSYPWPDPNPSGSGRISSETSVDSGLVPIQAGNNRKT